jgi:hypothetical protein
MPIRYLAMIYDMYTWVTKQSVKSNIRPLFNSSIFELIDVISINSCYSETNHGLSLIINLNKI